MLFEVLGPLEVQGADPAGLRARKPRTLLTTLLLHANSWVGLDELVAAIWAEQPPASAERNVTTYVWQLRKALPVADGPRIDGRSGAYRLRVEPDELDLTRFESLARLGQQALAEGRPHEAGEHLQRARELWRGRPFDGLDSDAAQVEAARLGERYWEVRERLAESLIAGGRTAEAVAVLTALTAEDPLREAPWCHLVTALHRAGRPADALAAYQRARTTLIEELGVEPGPTLRALHQRILTEADTDDGLDPVQRRLLGLLALVPGPTFDRFAAGALCAAEPATVETSLDQLATAGPLVRQGSAHYALRERVSPVVDRAALDRLFDHYVHAGLDAAGAAQGEVLRDWSAGSSVPTFTGPADGLAWLAVERDNLLAATAACVRTERTGHAWRLTRALQAHVDASGPPAEWEPLLRELAEAVRATGDTQGELVARNALGIACWRAGEREQALVHLGAALETAQTTADPRTIATVLLNLAEATEALDRPAGATAYLDQACTLLREVDCPALTAIADDCRVRLRHAAVSRAAAGVLYRRWTHAVPPAQKLEA